MTAPTINQPRTDTTSPHPPNLTPTARPARRHNKTVKYLAVIAAAAATVAVLRTWIVAPYTIPSGSMEPTLQPGDLVIADQLSTHPHRGQIIVFRLPANIDPTYGGDTLVKRVVAVPGDTITITGGHILINGHPDPEKYLPAGTTTINPPGKNTTIRLQPGSYFVMGDNRSHSYDSRYFGPIRQTWINGTVIIRDHNIVDVHIF